MAAQAEAVGRSVQGVATVAEENLAATEEVSASTEQVSAQVQEMTAQAQHLATMAEQLKELVELFERDDIDGTAGTSRPGADRPRLARHLSAA
jgi:methyl-accepting chemotaxis protein